MRDGDLSRFEGHVREAPYGQTLDFEPLQEALGRGAVAFFSGRRVYFQ